MIVEDKVRLPGKTYQVRSGTATSRPAAEEYKSRTAPGVDFGAATESVSDQEIHFRNVLDELSIPLNRAAVLAEEGTAFGKAASRAASNDDICVFRFPRDISHLRDSYRQSVQASQTSKTPTPSLDFSLKDSGVGEDKRPHLFRRSRRRFPKMPRSMRLCARSGATISAWLR